MINRTNQKEDYLSPGTQVYRISCHPIIAASELGSVNGGTESFFSDQSSQLEYFNSVNMGGF